VSSILTHFYGTPSTIQAELLIELEKQWDFYDVFSIIAPTAFGKTRVAHAIADWSNSATITVPNNILLDQYKDNFPDSSILYKRASYKCKTYPQRSCEETHKKLKRCCGGGECNYLNAVKRAKQSPLNIVNYYTYLVHKLYSKTLIVDEAHLLLQTLQEFATKRIWKKTYGWPSSIQTLADIAGWLETVANLDKKLQKLHKEILATNPCTLVRRDVDWLRGQEEEVLKLIPLDTKNEPPIFWPPSKVKKIVLLSATLGKPDIESLGLSKKRVLFLECPSPIPVENRPIIYHKIANMSHRYQTESLPKIAKYIQYLLNEHPDKGMIHTPYSVAGKLKKYLEHEDRLVWHDRENKVGIVEDFIDSDPEEGQVLVGSGLYEGLDLVDDTARWQVITKVPYPSLYDPAIRSKLEQDEAWYAWATIRPLLQASGRICRGPQDYGVTYILDTAFSKLYNTHKELFPDWWTSALLEETS